MNELERFFNPRAFVAPITRAEKSALLDEALRMASDLEDSIDDMEVILAQKSKPSPPHGTT